jgi:hypothetical protein
LEHNPKTKLNLAGIIIRPQEILNMEHFGMEISISFLLKGESACWIFNRVNEYFDENTMALKIEKNDKNKIFASLGTFVRNSSNDLIFKVFSREQLVFNTGNPN